MTAIIFLDEVPLNAETCTRNIAEEIFDVIHFVTCTNGFTQTWHRLSKMTIFQKLKTECSIFMYVISGKKCSEHADVVYASTIIKIPTLLLSYNVSSNSLLTTLASGEEKIKIRLTEEVTNLCEKVASQTATSEEKRNRYLSSLEKIIYSFLYVAPEMGHVIVVEGGDGCGKATQTKMLINHCKEEIDNWHVIKGRSNKCCTECTSSLAKHWIAEIPNCEHLLQPSVQTLEFPNEQRLFGDLIRIVLSGKKGNIKDLDPKLFSFIYSSNRFASLPELRYWTRHGDIVVLDRYYTANFGHQAAKLPKDERGTFIAALEEFEVNILDLPKANIVFYLDLPPQSALLAMRSDSTRAFLDIHETAGVEYKESVRETFLWCCEKFSEWHHIMCCDTYGKRLTREQVHERIWAILEKEMPLHSQLRNN